MNFDGKDLVGRGDFGLLLAKDTLTDDDMRTLRRLVELGIGENSRRAITSDLRYISAWSTIATGSELPWPPTVDLVLKFIAHHMWSVEERERDADHGMPAVVSRDLKAAGLLRVDGPHAVSTVRRRLSHWRSLCDMRGIPHPFDDPVLRRVLRKAGRAHAAPEVPKSMKPVTLEVIERLNLHLLTQCEANAREERQDEAVRLAAWRDRALLMLAFNSGGRRRSEVANLRVADLERLDPVPLIGSDGHPVPGRSTPSMAIRLGRTKTSGQTHDQKVHITGEAVEAVQDWITEGQIAVGALFRPINRWGQVGAGGMTDKAVNLILKKRLAEIGEDAAEFSAHGIRSGYLTSAARLGVSLPEAMRQSTHRSAQQATRYFNDSLADRSRAAQIPMLLRRAGED